VNQLPTSVMDQVLCYLETSEVSKLARVCEKWKGYVLSQWDLRLAFLILEIETMKVKHRIYEKAFAFERMHLRLPLVFENGFYSPYFRLLDTILSEEKSCVVTRNDLEDIKAIVKPSPAIKEVARIFCALTGMKPKRQALPNGQLEIDYFSPLHKAAIQNKLS